VIAVYANSAVKSANVATLQLAEVLSLYITASKQAALTPTRGWVDGSAVLLSQLLESAKDTPEWQTRRQTLAQARVELAAVEDE
jgi:hypothetical protein